MANPLAIQNDSPSTPPVWLSKANGIIRDPDGICHVIKSETFFYKIFILTTSIVHTLNNYGLVIDYHP